VVVVVVLAAVLECWMVAAGQRSCGPQCCLPVSANRTLEVHHQHSEHMPTLDCFQHMEPTMGAGA